MAVTFLASEVAQAGQTTLTIVIFALVVVALLLALLTAWYWQHTKPLPPMADRQRRMQQQMGDQSLQRGQGQPGQARQGQTRISVNSGQAHPDSGAPQQGDQSQLSVDEWLSLTGPDKPRRKGR